MGKEKEKVKRMREKEKDQGQGEVLGIYQKKQKKNSWRIKSLLLSQSKRPEIAFIYGNKGQRVHIICTSLAARGNGVLISTFGPAEGSVFCSETALTPCLLKPHPPLSEFWRDPLPLRLFTVSSSAAHMAFSFTYRSPKDLKQQQAD